MTGQHDPTETLLEKTLAGQAEHAPSDGDLLTQVHGRLRRRRVGRTTAAVVLACAAVAAGIAGVNAVTDDVTPAPQVASASDGDWRWESYQSVEVQVPANWGTHGPGIDFPSCLIDELGPPTVSRPGAMPAIACEGPVDPAYRTSSLTFDARDRQAGVRQYDHGWAEETRILDGVRMTVFSNDADLRRRILDSARLIDGTDRNGCTPDHRLAQRPEGRPHPAGGPESVGTVDSVAVCRYRIGANPPGRSAALVASSKATGDAAGALVNAIVIAPVGIGPNPAGPCSNQFGQEYGEELLVLKVHGADRDQEVLVRYLGCAHNGTDDGTTLRQLTAGVVQPLLTGLHHPTAYHDNLRELLEATPSK